MPYELDRPPHWRKSAFSWVKAWNENPHELVSYGGGGGAMKTMFTALVGDGTRVTRPLRWLAAVAQNPVRFARLLATPNWSRRTVIVLVMQVVDSALRFAPRRRLWGGCGSRPSRIPRTPTSRSSPPPEPLRSQDIADAVLYIVTRDRRAAANEVLVRAAEQSW